MGDFLGLAAAGQSRISARHPVSLAAESQAAVRVHNVRLACVNPRTRGCRRALCVTVAERFVTGGLKRSADWLHAFWARNFDARLLVAAVLTTAPLSPVVER